MRLQLWSASPCSPIAIDAIGPGAVKGAADGGYLSLPVVTISYRFDGLLRGDGICPNVFSQGSDPLPVSEALEAFCRNGVEHPLSHVVCTRDGRLKQISPIIKLNSASEQSENNGRGYGAAVVAVLQSN